MKVGRALRRRSFLAGLPVFACGLGAPRAARAEPQRFKIARAIANAEAAIGAKVDLLIEYNADVDANAEIARRLAAASIPALALVDPLPGARLYGPDNRAAGQIAGRALVTFARENWPGEQVFGVLIGDLAAPGAAIKDRVRGITEGVHESLPALQLAALDTGGQSVRADALLTK